MQNFPQIAKIRCREICDSPNCEINMSRKFHVIRFSFLSQKQRWGEQTCNQLKTVEQFCCLPSFQNGRAALAKAFNPEGRLDDKNRSQGCLLYCANRSTAPSTPLFSLRGHKIPVYVCLPFGFGPAPL